MLINPTIDTQGHHAKPPPPIRIVSITDLDSSFQRRPTAFAEPGLSPLSLLLTSSAAPPVGVPVMSFRRLKRMKNDTKGNTTNSTKYTKSFGFEAFRSMLLMYARTRDAVLGGSRAEDGLGVARDARDIDDDVDAIGCPFGVELRRRVFGRSRRVGVRLLSVD